MVDLGFLLITFFMLTTKLMEENAMELRMPAKEEAKSSIIKESKVLTLLLNQPGTVHFYYGISNATLDSTDFSSTGIRQAILEKKKKVEDEFGADETVVLIKPGDESTYQDVINAIDEMAICEIQRYVLMELTQAEVDFIKNPADGLNPDLIFPSSK